MPAPSPPHVVLVGLMGSGKTTVGRLVARRLDRPLVDNDEEVERRTGATAAEIAERDGEDALHAVEADVLLDAVASAVPSIVVAAASVGEDERAIEALRSPVVEVVWLRGDPEVLAHRAAGSDHRPLGGDVEATLRAQASRRDPIYAAVATHVVDVEVGPPDALAELLVDRILEPRR